MPDRRFAKFFSSISHKADPPPPRTRPRRPPPPRPQGTLPTQRPLPAPPQPSQHPRTPGRASTRAPRPRRESGKHPRDTPTTLPVRPLALRITLKTPLLDRLAPRSPPVSNNPTRLIPPVSSTDQLRAPHPGADGLLNPTPRLPSHPTLQDLTPPDTHSQRGKSLAEPPGAGPARPTPPRLPPPESGLFPLRRRGKAFSKAPSPTRTSTQPTQPANPSRTAPPPSPLLSFPFRKLPLHDPALAGPPGSRSLPRSVSGFAVRVTERRARPTEPAFALRSLGRAE